MLNRFAIIKYFFLGDQVILTIFRENTTKERIYLAKDSHLSKLAKLVESYQKEMVHFDSGKDFIKLTIMV